MGGGGREREVGVREVGVWSWLVKLCQGCKDVTSLCSKKSGLTGVRLTSALLCFYWHPPCTVHERMTHDS